jgi:hypothetical protein
MKVSLRSGLVALMGVTFTAIGVAAWREGTASSAGNGVVSLRPPSQVVTLGEKVTIDVAVSNVTNLASWEVKLRYNPDVLTFESFAGRPFLESTGRAVSCLDPVVNPAEPGTVQLGCVSSSKDPPGVNGEGVVATVTFATKGAGTTAIEILKAELAEPLGDNCCGAVVTQEAAVRVVSSQQEESSAAPPPTPTPNPRKLTPTPVGATPAPSLALTPSAGGSEPPAGTGGVAGAVASPPGSPGGGANAGGPDDLFRSASGATAPGERNAPRAGEGSLARARAETPVTIGSGLAIAGALMVAATLSRQRQGTTGRLES